MDANDLHEYVETSAFRRAGRCCHQLHNLFERPFVLAVKFVGGLRSPDGTKLGHYFGRQAPPPNRASQ